MFFGLSGHSEVILIIMIGIKSFLSFQNLIKHLSSYLILAKDMSFRDYLVIFEKLFLVMSFDFLLIIKTLLRIASCTASDST